MSNADFEIFATCLRDAGVPAPSVAAYVVSTDLARRGYYLRKERDLQIRGALIRAIGEMLKEWYPREYPEVTIGRAYNDGEAFVSNLETLGFGQGWGPCQ